MNDIPIGNGIGVIHVIPGSVQPADGLCSDCLNPAMVQVDVYGYGDDPTEARLIGCQRLCADCERIGR